MTLKTGQHSAPMEDPESGSFGRARRLPREPQGLMRRQPLVEMAQVC